MDAKLVAQLVRTLKSSERDRRCHQRHVIVLVLQGVPAPEAARLFGDPLRTVQHWVRRFEQEGSSSLERRRRFLKRLLSGDSRKRLIVALRQHPSPASIAGMTGTRWTGEALKSYLEAKFSVKMSVRSCQRLLRELIAGGHVPKPSALPSRRAEVVKNAAAKADPADGKAPRARPLGMGKNIPTHEAAIMIGVTTTTFEKHARTVGIVPRHGRRGDLWSEADVEGIRRMLARGSR